MSEIYPSFLAVERAEVPYPCEVTLTHVQAVGTEIAGSKLLSNWEKK